MKAVVYQSATSVTVGEWPEPAAEGPDETLVDVVACGLCGSDMQMLTDPPSRYCEPGTVIGHEIVGRVNTPSEGSELQPGDLVVVVPNQPCRRCASCKRGLINLCDNFRHLGVHRPGGLAERLWVPDELLHKVPAGLDAHVAALAEPLACILNGTTRARLNPADPVVILGGGPIGLLFLAVAKLAGAQPIVVTEPNQARAAVARRMGADHVVDPSRDGGVEEITEILNGTGAQTVFDTVGTLLATALSVVAKAGEIYVFGVSQGTEIAVIPTTILRKEVSIHGIVIAKGTFPLALRTLAAHPELFALIISDRVPIEEWDRAKDRLLTRSAPGKILVTVNT
jgi:threonine dehydrogenase-like Zn-dependent dehydrogenase